MTIVSPNEVKLSCEISPGEPRAELTWYKNGRELGASSRYVYSYEQAEASLTIPMTTGDDAGDYMVKASNKLRTVDTDCTLTVHGKLHLSLSRHLPIDVGTLYLQAHLSNKMWLQLLLAVQNLSINIDISKGT